MCGRTCGRPLGGNTSHRSGRGRTNASDANKGHAGDDNMVAMTGSQVGDDSMVAMTGSQVSDDSM